MARKKAQRKQETTLVPHRTPNLSALLERAKSGNSRQAVKAYLDAGGSPVALVHAQAAEHMLQLPLLHCMAFTNAHPNRELAECVRLLVAAGADIEALFTDPTGIVLTPLMCAIESTCCTAVPAALLQAGADPCTRSPRYNQTVLHRAMRLGLAATCELLLARAHTLLEARDMAGWTALTHAATVGRLDVVKLLLQRGADVNTVNDLGVTPLVAACLEKHSNVVACLLKAGANVHVVDPQ
jgi:Ankyrin repeats (3 copies)/Ankyrin repeat